MRLLRLLLMRLERPPNGSSDRDDSQQDGDCGPRPWELHARLSNGSFSVFGRGVQHALQRVWGVNGPMLSPEFFQYFVQLLVSHRRSPSVSAISVRSRPASRALAR